MGTHDSPPPPSPLLIFGIIHRLRWVFLAGAGLLVLVAFNGQWRIGRDSAAYRGLGHHLATTGRYTFRDTTELDPFIGDQDTIRYPGLPVMLAGIEKVAGRSDAAPILVICGLALATLLLSHRLTRGVQGTQVWLATAVVFGLAINREFLQHAHEILSDIPFLFFIVASLVLYPRVRACGNWKTAIGPVVMFSLSLIAAASLRPTFWFFAAALVAALVADSIRPPKPADDAGAAAPTGSRRRSLILLTILAAASLMFFLIDIRNKNNSILGGYEKKILQRLDTYLAPRRLLANAHEAFEDALPEAFFSTQFGPGFVPLGGWKWGMSTVASLLLLLSPLAMRGRGRHYILFPMFTIIALAGLGAVSRYFVMILPLLLISWGMLAARVARRIGHPAPANAFVCCALAVVVIPNFLRSFVFVLEQHGYSAPYQKGKGWSFPRQVGFMNLHSSGGWRDVRAVAEMIKKNTQPTDRVIGPEATVLSYLSERNVYGLGKLMPPRDRNGMWARTIKRMRFSCAVFPPAGSRRNLYEDKDGLTGQLIAQRILRPRRTRAAAAGYTLAYFDFSIPERRNTPVRQGMGTGTRRLTRATQPAATLPAATRPARYTP